MSVVRVVRISGVLPPMLIRPTEDSGFAPVFAEKIRLTASACASHRVGLAPRQYIGAASTAPRYVHVVAIPTCLAVVNAANS